MLYNLFIAQVKNNNGQRKIKQKERRVCRLPTEVELAVELLAVDDVEAVVDVCLHVRHLEVEPLVMVVRVHVGVQYQVVLARAHLQLHMFAHCCFSGCF